MLASLLTFDCMLKIQTSYISLDFPIIFPSGFKCSFIYPSLIEVTLFSTEIKKEEDGLVIPLRKF